jgi:hypothetical protein
MPFAQGIEEVDYTVIIQGSNLGPWHFANTRVIDNGEWFRSFCDSLRISGSIAPPDFGSFDVIGIVFMGNSRFRISECEDSTCVDITVTIPEVDREEGPWFPEPFHTYHVVKLAKRERGYAFHVDGPGETSISRFRPQNRSTPRPAVGGGRGRNMPFTLMGRRLVESAPAASCMTVVRGRCPNPNMKSLKYAEYSCW